VSLYFYAIMGLFKYFALAGSLEMDGGPHFEANVELSPLTRRPTG
jgi:hypothetical protein